MFPHARVFPSKYWAATGMETKMAKQLATIYMNNFFTLNLSYGELLGMFPLEVSVISFDISHVGIHVARGNKRLGASDKFLLIVHTIEQDGNARLEGDEVETLFQSGFNERVPSGVTHNTHRSSFFR